MAERRLVIDAATGEVLNAIVVDPAHPLELAGASIVVDTWGADIGDRIVSGRLERRPAPPPGPEPPPELVQARRRLAEAEEAWTAGDHARMAAALQDVQAAVSVLSVAPVESGKESLR